MRDWATRPFAEARAIRAQFEQRLAGEKKKKKPKKRKIPGKMDMDQVQPKP